jgi:dopamine D1-like receptor
MRYVNRARTLYILLFVWLASAALGCTQIVLSEKSLIHDMYECRMDLKPVYAITSSTLSFFAPAAVMVILYTKLYLYARAHVRSIRSQLRAVTGACTKS